MEHNALCQLISGKKPVNGIYKRILKPLFELTIDMNLTDAVDKIKNTDSSALLTKVHCRFRTLVTQQVNLSPKLDLLAILPCSYNIPSWISITDGLFCSEKLTIIRTLLSSHNLRVETDRWFRKGCVKIERKDRICRVCLSNQAEEPMHFLLICPEFDDERRILLATLELESNEVVDWNKIITAIFLALTTPNTAQCKALSQFFHAIFSHDILRQIHVT
jgi:hypothetical protein